MNIIMNAIHHILFGAISVSKTNSMTLNKLSNVHTGTHAQLLSLLRGKKAGKTKREVGGFEMGRMGASLCVCVCKQVWVRVQGRI